MLRQNSIQKIIQNNFCMVNSIQNSIQNFEISWIQFNKIFIQFENVGIDQGYTNTVYCTVYCIYVLCSGCTCTGFICIVLALLPALLHINLHQFAAAKVVTNILEPFSSSIGWPVSHAFIFSHSLASKPFSGGEIR